MRFPARRPSEPSAAARARAATIWQGAFGTVALLSAACSVETREYTADADTGSRHALIRIERTTSIDDGSEQATALAGFVEIPPTVEADVAMRLVGLSPSLPAVGQCAVAGRETESASSLNPLGQVTFLDAGQVHVQASDQSSSLAPHAFPTVTDFISGVVYTSRDREAALLPADADYAIDSTGGLELGALTLGAHAPENVQGAYAAGLPLGKLGTVALGRPLDVSWSPSSTPVTGASDVIYVELKSDAPASERSNGVVCTFHDQAGNGSVPTESFVPGDTGSIAIHRLRTYELTPAGVDEARTAFDFELNASVIFGE